MFMRLFAHGENKATINMEEREREREGGWGGRERGRERERGGVLKD